MMTKSLFTLFIFCVFSIASFGQGKRYVKVVERISGKPLDSMVVDFYHVVDNWCFHYVEGLITGPDGLVMVPDSFIGTGKINANSQDGAWTRIWPAVENVKNFTRDTLVIIADVLPHRGRRMENIYFAYGLDSLIDFYKDKLRDIAPTFIKILEEDSSLRIEIRSHTDGKEAVDPVQNDLSQRRADKVKVFLQSLGIRKNKMLTSAKGSAWPLVPEEKDGQDDPEGRAMNRRVEFIILTSDQ
jgi:outer membrane protein OmpA-like peptidoglycan-associated protein